MTWYASDGLTSQQLSATHGSGAGMEYIFNLTVSKKLPQPINLTSYSVNGWTENSYDGKIQ